MSHLYADRLRVRHDELDTFGRVYPAAYLRWMADTAIAASADAGFDAGWYRRAGAWWLVRRSRLDVRRPLGPDDGEVTVRTWVEDFRRVRSWRRYEIVDAAGEVAVSGVSDWVFADTVSGKPRRVPAEMEQAFGFEPGHTGAARPAWGAPPRPDTPARTPHRVRYTELDSLQHVNNASYLDILAQGALDALEGVGWPLERMVAHGAVPWVASLDVEYLESALYGDRLEVVSWFGLAAGGIDVHQEVVRASDAAQLVRASSGWRWARRSSGAAADAPDGLADALGALRAA